MLFLVNPRVTKPENRRFPLSLLNLGAALPAEVNWQIVDENRPGVDVLEEVSRSIRGCETDPQVRPLIAITVMPGPQLPRAVALSKELKSRHPQVPIVWGGYFPSLYPEPVLESNAVDWLIRGQGERTLVELLEALRGERDPHTIAGLWFKNAAGEYRGKERVWEGPDAFPPPPYHKINVGEYLKATFLGQRTGVYQSSIGCPYGCSFCGVIGAFGRKELFEDPERVETNLRLLVENHGLDAVHFYDNNFFLKEDRALDLCGRLESLSLNWWCEARIDVLLRFTDTTWRRIAASGLKMVFLGAESGSNESLLRMDKQLTVEQIEEIAVRTREHCIAPEFSFCLGDPEDPEADVLRTLALIRRLKQLNESSEIILYYYTPTPQRRPTAYGSEVDEAPTPATLEEWSEPAWVDWMSHTNPHLPWLSADLRTTVESFQLVLSSRFPSQHDRRIGAWRKQVLRAAAWWRWWRGDYSDPYLLRRLKKWSRTPEVDAQAYGHLREQQSEA